MEIEFVYFVTFGKGDGSEALGWSVEVSQEDFDSLCKEVKKGVAPEDTEVGSRIYSQAYDEIEEYEWQCAIEMHDQWAIECEEKGISPYSNGWTLTVDFANPELFELGDGDTTQETIEAHIHKLLVENPDDFEEIEEYIDKVENYYAGNLYEYTFREAIRSGITDYVEAYAENFDLNDGPGYSTYLHETEDPDMQDILMDLGAFKSWEDYEDCSFAMETVNGEILAFKNEFQKEVFNAYLEHTMLTRDKVIQMLDDDYYVDEDDELPEDFDRYIDDDFAALGISISNEEIEFEDKIGDDGWGVKELLEELGWECSFEGQQWKLETTGVYFID